MEVIESSKFYKTRFWAAETSSGKKVHLIEHGLVTKDVTYCGRAGYIISIDPYYVLKDNRCSICYAAVHNDRIASFNFSMTGLT